MSNTVLATPALRPADQVMDLARLGSHFQSPLSFVRSSMRPAPGRGIGIDSSFRSASVGMPSGCRASTMRRASVSFMPLSSSSCRKLALSCGKSLRQRVIPS